MEDHNKLELDLFESMELPMSRTEHVLRLIILVLSGFVSIQFLRFIFSL